MKTIFVTSDVTYVKDNYLSLIDRVTSQKDLPAGIDAAAVIMIKVPEKLLLKIFSACSPLVPLVSVLP